MKLLWVPRLQVEGANGQYIVTSLVQQALDIKYVGWTSLHSWLFRLLHYAIVFHDLSPGQVGVVRVGGMTA